MKIILEGTAFIVNKVLLNFEHSLKNMNISYHKVIYGGRYARSHVKISLLVNIEFKDFTQFLSNPDISVEIIEETPGVTFRSVSEKGSYNFTHNSDITEINTEASEFEDLELYEQRMRDYGVIG